MTTEQYEFLEPYEKLIPLKVLGRAFEVPENSNVLRAFQYVQLETGQLDVDYRDFCWNRTCDHCRVTYRLAGEEREREAMGCVLDVRPGMEIVRAPKTVRFTRQAGQASVEYLFVFTLTIGLVVALSKLGAWAAVASYLWAAAHLFPPWP